MHVEEVRHRREKRYAESPGERTRPACSGRRPPPVGAPQTPARCFRVPRARGDSAGGAESSTRGACAPRAAAPRTPSVNTRRTSALTPSAPPAPPPAAQTAAARWRSARRSTYPRRPLAASGSGIPSRRSSGSRDIARRSPAEHLLGKRDRRADPGRVFVNVKGAVEMRDAQALEFQLASITKSGPKYASSSPR